nr:acyltransferase family protein [Hyphomonas sp. Mor2]
MSVREYRADIDGLRALAVSAVVIYHAVPGLLPSGFVGVDIFFVISGYLIGGIIYSGIVTDRFTFANFYSRRVKRILPALIVVITATLLAGLFILDSFQFKVLSTQSITALIGASNFYFWEHTGYFDTASELQPLLMTWSLGVEEQFYVLFPFVIFAITKAPRAYRAWIMLALTALSFLFMLWISTRDQVSAFYLLPSRAWELGIGAALAMVQVNRETAVDRIPKRDLAAVLGLVLIVIAVFTLGPKDDFPIIPIILSVLGTILLIATPKSWINRHILSFRAVVFVGLISYSWYLWHWPIMAYFRIVADENPSQIALMAAVPLSFLIAVFSWRFIEQPFRTPQTSSGRPLWLGASALAAAMILPAIGHISKGIPERLPSEVRLAEEIRLQGRGNCLMGGKDTAPVRTDTCHPEGARIALLGDSHASALGTGLAAFAEQNGTHLAQHTKSACGPYLGYSYSSSVHPNSIRTCGAYFNAAVELVLNDPNIEVIVVGSYWPKDLSRPARALEENQLGASIPVADIIDQSITDLLIKAQIAEKSVILVQDVPMFEVDTMSRSIGDRLPARRMLREWVSSNADSIDAVRLRADTAAMETEEILQRVSETFSNTYFFKVRDQFCEDRICVYTTNDKPLFFDRHHISSYGSHTIDWSEAFEHAGFAPSERRDQE